MAWLMRISALMLCCLMSIWALNNITVRGNPGFRSDRSRSDGQKKGGRRTGPVGWRIHLFAVFHLENVFREKAIQNVYDPE